MLVVFNRYTIFIRLQTMAFKVFFIILCGLQSKVGYIFFFSLSKRLDKWFSTFFMQRHILQLNIT